MVVPPGLRNALFFHIPVGGPAVNDAQFSAQEAKYLCLKAWHTPV